MKMIEPLVFSRSGPTLLFTHANGYPPESYRTFLIPLLHHYQVMAISLRPFYPGSNPDNLTDWKDFRDDYLHYLDDLEFNPGNSSSRDNNSNQVIAVGHSVGAMTSLMAAIERPHLFRALVLIEPVIFPPLWGILTQILSPFNLAHRVYPLARTTLRRRTRFPSRKAMFENYRRKPIFSRLSDDVLRDYVEGLARDLPDGFVELKYSPAWETRIYETGGIADPYVWRNLPKVNCPVLILRGEETNILRRRVIWLMLKRISNGKAFSIPETGHLVPLEAPYRTARIVLDFLQSNLKDTDNRFPE